MRRLAPALLSLTLVACEGDSSQASVSPTPAPSPSREPATLPELAWERQIIDGLRREGIELTLIGGSKFARKLGPELPARVFMARPGSGGEGADVLFIDRPTGDITVCTTQKHPTENYWSSSVAMDGHVTSRGEGTQHLRYSVSDRFFVMAVGQRFDDAMRKILGTAPPRCGDPAASSASVAPGYSAGTCTPGSLTNPAGSSEYTFQTTVIDERNEQVVIEKRAARIGERLSATLVQLDGPGLISLPPFAAEPVASGGLVFKVGVYKPAGAGCWRVDLIDATEGRHLASHVVLVRQP